MQQDCEKNEGCKPQEPFVKLWCLTYKVLTDPDYEGMAVVSALTPGEAQDIFIRETQHNGNPDKIRVGRIDQIPFPVVPKLIMENYVRVFRAIQDE